MPSAQTLEDCLILACARTEADIQRIQGLVERAPDWQVILRKAERLGLASLIQANLREAAGGGRVPKPVSEHLRRLSHRESIASLTLRDALRSILPQLPAAGIPVVVLKGAALAALVYPSPALRPIRAADLLVQRQDLDKADELLRRIGYVRERVAPGRQTAAHCQYVLLDRFAPVRLHDHILSPETDAARVSRIPIEDFWGRCIPAQIESEPTLVFGSEDLLLHIALHLSANRFAGHAQALCDIAEVCKCCAIDWSRVVAQSAHYKVSKHIYYSLLLARDLVGARVPFGALTDLRANFWQLPLEGRFIVGAGGRAILSERLRPEPFGKVYKNRFNLHAVRAVRNRIISACRQKAEPFRQNFQRLLATRALSGTRNYAVPHAGEVAVTYDNQNSNEGLGAQLQRIYGLYALSRGLKIKYVHTPIRRVDYQGFLPLLSGNIEPNFAERYNAFFSLPSDHFDLSHCQRFKEGNLSVAKVERYRQLAASTGRPVLLEVLTPYGYTDEHPAAYLALRAVTPYRGYRATGPVRVCIHLRRGDNALQRPDQKDRLLPNSYYIRVCSAVVDALRRHGAPFIVRLHTEMPLRPYTLHPGLAGIQFNMAQSSTISPEQYALEDFEVLPNLEFVLNGEPQVALDDFATADVLIISMSSFSYLGGLLNPHGLVIYAPFWHAPLPDWLVADERGGLDVDELEARIARHLRHRGQD